MEFRGWGSALKGLGCQMRLEAQAKDYLNVEELVLQAWLVAHACSSQIPILEARRTKSVGDLGAQRNPTAQLNHQVGLQSRQSKA